MTIHSVREHITIAVNHAKVKAQDLRRSIADDQKTLSNVEAMIAEYEATLVQLGPDPAVTAVPETVLSPDVNPVLV